MDCFVLDGVFFPDCFCSVHIPLHSTLMVMHTPDTAALPLT